ncbi:hypothetical protein STRATTON_89 [Erwinia phage vB_EamM_Stratton]|uniref:Uncharacterized protein n=2 Tax=Erskinevirus EaH2 TaxID=2169883 RepID=A0A1B2IH06_9CAUD|nr:hypothetical protein G173_gp256 [Erwinia phage phiEaH2]AFQ96801.1 hypothetical protein [Erwinia phage phiEaH2]ANZ50514.1 hypothetical protein STRATTON_89 [Erwinia phage vB_EamM_Stratton]
MDMKKEFDFKNHKPDTTTKHYFGKEELDGVVIHDKLDDSKVPESDYATRKQQLAQTELDKFDVSRGLPESLKPWNLPPENVGKGVVLKHILHEDLPVDANGKVADLAPPRGMYRDEDGNFRDLKELRKRDLLLGGDFEDGEVVKIIKGLGADYDGISLPLHKPSRAEKSVSKYRNVMNGLIARASKK